MTNTPQRFDHTDDGFETAKDGDFVFYDDYAALVARVAELERVFGVLRALSYTHSRGVRSEEFVSLFKSASHALGIKTARVKKGANAEAVMRAALLRED
jgi:diphthamide biosynthesis methyltransferase